MSYVRIYKQTNKQRYYCLYIDTLAQEPILAWKLIFFYKSRPSQLKPFKSSQAHFRGIVEFTSKKLRQIGKGD